MHPKLGNKEKWDFFLNQPIIAHELKKAALTQILSEDKGRKYFFLECFLTPQRPSFFESVEFEQIYGVFLKVNNLQKYADKINKEMNCQLIKKLKITDKDKRYRYYYVDTTQEPFCWKENENNPFEIAETILKIFLQGSEYDETLPKIKQSREYIKNQKKVLGTIKNGDDLRKILLEWFSGEFIENYIIATQLFGRIQFGETDTAIKNFFSRFNTDYLPMLPQILKQKEVFLKKLEANAKKEKKAERQFKKITKNAKTEKEIYKNILLNYAKEVKK